MAAALHLVPIRRPVSRVAYHITTNGMLGLVTHTQTYTQSLALYRSCRLHVPSESDVGSQQVAHANHTRHYHHGEAEPVRSKETTDLSHLPCLPLPLQKIISCKPQRQEVQRDTS